jgi:diaminopimelate decarboxylase
MLCRNIGTGTDGHLTFAGRDTVELAEKYGTPLYLMDERRIRENCRMYKAAMEKNFGGSALPLYASKAAAFRRMYAIAAGRAWA